MVVRKMVPGPGGSRNAGPPGAPGPPPSYWPRPRSRGPPGPPGGPLEAPRGLWRTPGLPQKSQGPPGSPQEPRAPSSLPSPLPFPSLLFPSPLQSPEGPRTGWGAGDRTPPRGGLSPVKVCDNATPLNSRYETQKCLTGITASF